MGERNRRIGRAALAMAGAATISATVFGACAPEGMPDTPATENEDIQLAQGAVTELALAPHPNGFLALGGGGLEPSSLGIGTDGLVDPTREPYKSEIANYYSSIQAPLTFTAWKAKYQFPVQLAGETLDDFRTRAGNVVYYNVNELGLGRELGCSGFLDAYGSTNNPIRGWACYVTNYGTLFNDPNGVAAAQADAIFARTPKNTVAIAYIPHLPQGKQVQFFVYGEKGERLDGAQLDYMGTRAIPQVCTGCHGGSYAQSTQGSTSFAVDARFLPLNPNAVIFPITPPSLNRVNQLERVRRVNQIAWSTPLTGLQQRYVEQLYGEKPTVMNQPTASTVTPPGWSTQSTLYNTVVLPYCGTCHMAMAKSGTYLTSMFESWAGFSSSTPNGASPKTGNRDYVRAELCLAMQAPNTVSFTNTVKPLLKSKCGPCHDGSSLHNGAYDWNVEKNVLKQAAKIYNSISDVGGFMPPAGLNPPKVLSASEKATIRGYLATIGGMPHAQPTLRAFAQGWNTSGPFAQIMSQLGVSGCDNINVQGCNTNAQCGGAGTGQVCTNHLCVDNCASGGCPTHSECRTGSTICTPCGRLGHQTCKKAGAVPCEPPLVANSAGFCADCLTDAQCSGRTDGRVRCNPQNACVQCKDGTAPFGGGTCGPNRLCDFSTWTCVSGICNAGSHSCPGVDNCTPSGVCSPPSTISAAQFIQDKFSYPDQVMTYKYVYPTTGTDAQVRGVQATVDIAAAVPGFPSASVRAWESNTGRVLTDSVDFPARTSNPTVSSIMTNGFYNIQEVAWVDTTIGRQPTFIQVKNQGNAEFSGGLFTLEIGRSISGGQRMRYQERLIRSGEEHWIPIKADSGGRIAVELTHMAASGPLNFEIIDEGPWTPIASSQGELINHKAKVFVAGFVPAQEVFWVDGDITRTFYVHVSSPGFGTGRFANTYILTTGNSHACDQRADGTCPVSVPWFYNVNNTYLPNSPP